MMEADARAAAGDPGQLTEVNGEIRTGETEKEAGSGKKTDGGTKKTLKVTRSEPDPCVHTVLITDELDAWPKKKPVKAKSAQVRTQSAQKPFK